jgi:DNA polymerase-1
MQANGIEIIQDPRQAACLLEKDEEIACDLETGGLRHHADPIAVVSLYGQQTDTLAVLHVRGIIPPEVKQILENPAKRFTYHNGVTFDLPFLLENGVNATRPKLYDTMVGAGVAITTDRADQAKTLQAEIDRRLGVHIDKKTNHSSWMNKTLDEGQLLYCADDLLHMHGLRESQIEKVREQGQTSALDLEMAIVGSVARMTFNGLPLSIQALDDFRTHTQQIINSSRAILDNSVGPVNVNSSDQILKMLDGLGVRRPTWKTKVKDKTTGKYRTISKVTTRAEVLSALVQRGVPGLMLNNMMEPQSGESSTEFTERAEKALHIIDTVLKLRESTKRVDMYDDNWLSRYRSKRGRIHARFRQAGTATLRFSSNEPNLQQWPKNMRQVIGGEEGYSIVSSDYSQIEVVIAAELAGDSKLLKIIDEGGDIHRWVASMALNKNPDAVTSDERRLFKAANFCLIFGGSPETFQEYALGFGAVITLKEAEQIHDLYFATFQGLRRQKEYAQDLARSGRKVIEIRLRSGGVRHLVGASLKSTTILNTSVQGNAAAGMKFAILEARKKGLDKYFGATVHDELVAVVPTAWAEEYARELEKAMVTGMNRVIGARVGTEAKIAPFWS